MIPVLARTPLSEVRIFTPRVVLRPACTRDAASFRRAHARPELSRLLPSGGAYAAPRDPEIMKADTGALNLVASVDGAPVGALALRPERGVARLGLWIDPEHWGAGLGTEALRGALVAAFDVLGVDEVRARPFLDAPAALRVSQKLGFRRGAPCHAWNEARDTYARAAEMHLDRAAFDAVGRAPAAA